MIRVTPVFLICLILGIARPAVAHEGGHGPAPTGVGKYGGVLASVIQKTPLGQPGTHPAVVYHAELTRADDRTVRIYLYQPKSNTPPDLSQFATTAQGFVEVAHQGTHAHTPFALTREKNAFVGKAPAPARKPFTIEATFREGKRELFVAFENLD